LINEILSVEEGIAVAGTELLTVSEDERRRAWLMSAEKYELDVMTEKYEARCAGMAEGLAEGRTQGRAEGYKEAEAECQE
jgi:PHD/YefM family antitoxin component YafN of YafNO toxin-antitoxin module